MYIQKFKPDFLRNYCADLNQIFYESFQVQGPSSDLDLFYGKVKFGNLGFSIAKSENSEFSETIAASDLTVSRSSHLIEYMMVYEY